LPDVLANDGQAPKLFTLSKLLTYWTMATFLFAVGRLYWLEDRDFRVIVVYVIPLVLALLWRSASPRQSTRIFAASFLTLIDMGDLVAFTPFAVPEKLFLISNSMSEHDIHLLAWYQGVYGFCIFFLVPPFYCCRGLWDKHNGRKGGFSRFTCIVVLFAWLLFAWILMGPFLQRIISKFTGH